MLEVKTCNKTISASPVPNAFQGLIDDLLDDVSPPFPIGSSNSLSSTPLRAGAGAGPNSVQMVKSVKSLSSPQSIHSSPGPNLLDSDCEEGMELEVKAGDIPCLADFPETTFTRPQAKVEPAVLEDQQKSTIFVLHKVGDMHLHMCI